MKTIFLSAFLLFSLCTVVTAQRKTHFGFSIQSGTYLQTQHQHQDYGYMTIDQHRNAGILMGLGAYAERNLGRHLAISGGLNYAQSAFNEYMITVYPDEVIKTIGGGVYKQTTRFSVGQFALPIQLQWRLGNVRQVDFSLGITPTLTRTTLHFDPGNWQYPVPLYIDCICPDTPYYYASTEAEASTELQPLFSAGLHYRPDSRNALGLEFWLGPKAGETDYSHLYNYGYNSLFSTRPYRMHSLQVALRHSW